MTWPQRSSLLAGFSPDRREKADSMAATVKAKIVDYGEDLRVKIVDYGEDIRIIPVSYGEDIKIKIVPYGEQQKAKIVQSEPW